MSLQRTREQLSSAISAARNASTRQVTHVLQDPATGALLSSRTGYLAYDLSEALSCPPDALSIFGTEPTPVDEARAKLIAVLEEAVSSVEERLAPS